METPSLKQHKFCRKPFNEHSYHVRFQFAKWFQRRLKSKSLDNGCQVRAIHHTTFIFFIQSCHTPRWHSFFGRGEAPPNPLKYQLCDTNQVHNSDEGCNGHVRYCCNLASVVLCKLSQLNLSETTGLNRTKLFM